jgi:hypothetical protein
MVSTWKLLEFFFSQNVKLTGLLRPKKRFHDGKDLLLLQGCAS